MIRDRILNYQQRLKAFFINRGDAMSLLKFKGAQLDINHFVSDLNLFGTHQNHIVIDFENDIFLV